VTAFASFRSDRVFCAGSIKQQSRPDAVIKIKPVMITGFFYGCAASRHFCSAQAVNLKKQQSDPPGRVQGHKQSKAALSDPRPSL